MNSVIYQLFENALKSLITIAPWVAPTKHHRIRSDLLHFLSGGETVRPFARMSFDHRTLK